MAQRSRHAVSAGLEARSERPGDAVRAAPGMLHEKHGVVPFFLDTRETPASCRFSLGNLRLLVRSVANSFTKNTASCRFFFATSGCWCCAWHPCHAAKRRGDAV
jgi:hypothetical protein